MGSTASLFNVGDRVRVRKHQTTELEEPYVGPYEIIESKGPVYTLQIPGYGPYTVHHNRTKKFCDIESFSKIEPKTYPDEDTEEQETSIRRSSRPIRIPPGNLEFVKKCLSSFLCRELCRKHVTEHSRT
ncbi:hypothetical protein RF11_05598 [Thelohanellus kitauei]|uniref:Uncharacterized protein n=1 Tax=Thelohanellus kitauei TaxID=669202 RepID=A0A0C2M828_THEKT|nr:hypothetical protein RF11_05598 [Thelohanellus kitauei]